MQAKNNLQEAIEQENLELLKQASEEYFRARDKLEIYRGQKDIDQILLSSIEIENLKKLLETLSEETELLFRDANYPKSVSSNAKTYVVILILKKI